MALIEASIKREAWIAELEPYRTFVEHIRSQMQHEEQGRFGHLPPSL